MSALDSVEVDERKERVYDFEFSTYDVEICCILVRNTNESSPVAPKEALRLSFKATDLPGGNDVRVKSIKEADVLLREVLPNARKVIGTGPGQSGSPDWTKFKGKEPNGIYHKDYHFDPQTGRIYGPGRGNLHGDFKHINVKLTDGSKVTIIIEPN